MSQKGKTLKRKTATSEPVAENGVAQDSDEDYESAVSQLTYKLGQKKLCFRMQSDDGFFNAVNEDAEADSSDSDGDVEDSEGDDEGDEEDNSGSDEEEEEEEEEDDLGSDDEEEEDESEEEADNGSEEEVDNGSEEEAEPKKTITKNKRQLQSTSTSTDSGLDKTKDDEYADYDTSDEEDIRNTVGNIPMNWYDEYKHLGYDWDGKPIGKPESGDHLDNFLKRMEDPDFWRTVKDPQTGQDVVLSEEDIQVIQRLKAGNIPDVTFDEYAVRILF